MLTSSQLRLPHQPRNVVQLQLRWHLNQFQFNQVGFCFCFIVRLTCITAPCSQPRKIKSVLGISASAGKKCGRGYNRLSSANTPGWQLLQPIYQGVSPGLICDLASDISNTCCRFIKFDLKCRNWQSSSTLISASGSLRYRSFKYV